MSQLGILLNEEEDVILNIKARALADIAQGRVITTWNGEGTSVGKRYAMEPLDLLEECRFALQQLYPETYSYMLTRVRPFFA